MLLDNMILMGIRLQFVTDCESLFEMWIPEKKDSQQLPVYYIHYFTGQVSKFDNYLLVAMII